MEAGIQIVIVLLFMFAAFMLGRAVVLWYFRINEIVKLLTTMVSNTTKTEDDSI